MSAPLWTRTYVFGDSYSDTGAAYQDSNGPTAVAHLADRLGLTLRHSRESFEPADSVNFAMSGAPTSAEIRDVRSVWQAEGTALQVAKFQQLAAARRISFDPGSSLFLILAGLNDASLPTSETIGDLGSQVRALVSSGARAIAVGTLPSVCPGNDVWQRVNPLLPELIARAQTEHPEARIELSDWGGFYDFVFAHPERYGLENLTDACAGRAVFGENPTPVGSPDRYFFYHEGHPSAVVHRAAGELLADEIDHIFRPTR